MLIREKAYMTINSIGVYKQLVNVNDFDTDITPYWYKQEKTNDWNTFIQWLEEHNAKTIEINANSLFYKDHLITLEDVVTKGVWFEYVYTSLE